jgi:hypothetical protein
MASSNNPVVVNFEIYPTESVWLVSSLKLSDKNKWQEIAKEWRLDLFEPSIQDTIFSGRNDKSGLS